MTFVYRLILLIGYVSQNPLITRRVAFLVTVIFGLNLFLVNRSLLVMFLLLIFIRGVFVLVLYFSTLRRFIYEGVVGPIFLFILFFILGWNSVFFLRESSVNLSYVLFSSFIGLYIYIIFSLVMLMLFTSYVLSSERGLGVFILLDHNR